MAFNPNEMSVMASTGGDGGSRIWDYKNTDGDDVSVADYFLPFFQVNAPPPLHPNQRSVGAHNDRVYDAFNGIEYKVLFNNVINPTTVTTAPLGGANNPSPPPGP